MPDRRHIRSPVNADADIIEHLHGQIERSLCALCRSSRLAYLRERKLPIHGRAMFAGRFVGSTIELAPLSGRARLRMAWRLLIFCTIMGWNPESEEIDA